MFLVRTVCVEKGNSSQIRHRTKYATNLKGVHRVHVPRTDGLFRVDSLCQSMWATLSSWKLSVCCAHLQRKPCWGRRCEEERACCLAGADSGCTLNTQHTTETNNITGTIVKTQTWFKKGDLQSNARSEISVASMAIRTVWTISQNQLTKKTKKNRKNIPKFESSAVFHLLAAPSVGMLQSYRHCYRACDVFLISAVCWRNTCEKVDVIAQHKRFTNLEDVPAVGTRTLLIAAQTWCSRSCGIRREERLETINKLLCQTKVGIN